jgi:CPA2 family monovalent cation:H+ antiporter-2
VPDVPASKNKAYVTRAKALEKELELSLSAREEETKRD